MARPGQVRVRLIRVNIKLLLQLCVLGFIIYQVHAITRLGGSHGKQGSGIKGVTWLPAEHPAWPLCEAGGGRPCTVLPVADDEP